MKRRARNLLRRLRDLVRRQPVRVATAIAAIVVVVAPGVIDEDALARILAEVLTLAAIGEALRRLVFSPATVARMARGARG